MYKQLFYNKLGDIMERKILQKQQQYGYGPYSPSAGKTERTDRKE